MTNNNNENKSVVHNTTKTRIFYRLLGLLFFTIVAAIVSLLYDKYFNNSISYNIEQK